MKTLFVISLLSFLALLWAAIAITTHIRRTAISPGDTNQNFDLAGSTLKSTRKRHLPLKGRVNQDLPDQSSGELQKPVQVRRSRPVSSSTRKPSVRRA